MGQDHLIRPRWKIVNHRSPVTVSDVIDIILQNRKIDRRDISGELKDLAEHLCIRGMAEGAGLLAKHMADRNKIVVVADYDCDGITSAAQVALFLQETGYENFRVIIPSRNEGYGIPERAVSENPDAKVFLALDCGTLDLKPIRLALSKGADCIVIDHHEVPAGAARPGFGQAPAPASVLINPKQPECGSSFKEFCASGLTFLFLASLRRAIGNGFPLPALGGKYLALAATGTVADLVPLVSANRILARSRSAQSQRKCQRSAFTTGPDRRAGRKDLDRRPHRLLLGPAHKRRRAYPRGANRIRSTDLRPAVQVDPACARAQQSECEKAGAGGKNTRAISAHIWLNILPPAGRSFWHIRSGRRGSWALLPQGYSKTSIMLP